MLISIIVQIYCQHKKGDGIESKLHFKLHLVSGETLDIGRAYFENIKNAILNNENGVV